MMEMVVDYIAIGKRIRKVRQRLGYSQEQLAEMSGLTPPHLSHVETGNTKVSLPSLVQIANALDVTMDDLLADSLPHTGHVAMKEMNDLLLDCSDSECHALLHIMAASKEALRKK